MNIVMVTTNDPAGTGIAFTRAINRLSGHRCRLVTTELRYNFRFEKDLHVPWLEDCGELEEVLKQADLYHFHMTADEDLPLGPFRVRDFHRGQPIVHHHHGEPAFRSDPRTFAQRELERGRRAIVSTPDLLRSYPEATWIPNPVPLEAPDYRPRARREDPETLWVGHSPTRKDLKNTAEFQRVMQRVSRRRSHVRPRIIENTSHRECLRSKASCDLFFDHMQGYFGVSSLEALSQGVPTLAGIDDWNRERILEFTGCDELPWIVAHDEAELEREVLRHVDDSGLRREAGARAREWMLRHWTERAITEALLAFYEGGR